MFRVPWTISARDVHSFLSIPYSVTATGAPVFAILGRENDPVSYHDEQRTIIGNAK